MKFLFLSALLAVPSACWSIEPESNAAWVDTVIVFREGYVPTQFELNLSTSGIKFMNFTDFQKCRDEKDYLEEKIENLKPTETRKLKRSLDYLKAENAKR